LTLALLIAAAGDAKAVDGFGDHARAAAADPTDGNGLAPSGYTWVEDYINGLIPMP